MQGAGSPGDGGSAPASFVATTQQSDEPAGSPVSGAPIVAVTGAAGFIGRHLVRRLVLEGWRVRAIDLDPGDGWEDEGVEPLVGDIRDESTLRGMFQGAGVVFHLAAAHLQRGASPDWYHSVNVEGSRSLIAAAAAAGVPRVVHAGSVGIYGHVASPPADEDSPKHPTNDYERTKLLGETAALELAAELGIEVLALRPGWVYGPGCLRTAKLLRTVRRGRFFYIGDGSNLRHPLYVSDAVEAFVLAARAPSGAAGTSYLIVGPAPVSVRELVECCAVSQGRPPPRLRLPRSLVRAGLFGTELAFGLVGRDPPVSRRSLAFFEHSNAFSGRRAAEKLGFHPRVGLEEGIRATLGAREVADHPPASRNRRIS
jgi:nucleoside-diphosphate-sugar epimerase